MTPSTPFNRWSLNGEPDPHGDLYGDSYDDTNGISNYEVSERLAGYGCNIRILTLAKERLRYLSRTLLTLVDDCTPYNEKRAQLLHGDLTDDELANAFFIYETPEYRQAGSDRIKWLSECIETWLSDEMGNRVLKLLQCTPSTFSCSEDTFTTPITPVPKHYTKSKRGKFKKRNK